MFGTFFFSSQDPEFDPQKILAKSTAAGGLCAWVINIYRFYNVYLIVGPKQKALRDAQSELKAAQEKMDFFTKKIAVRAFFDTPKRNENKKIIFILDGKRLSRKN